MWRKLKYQQRIVAVAYTASIAIAVKGIQDLQALRDKIQQAAEGVDRFNNYAKTAFGGDFVRSVRNVNSALRDAADAFDKAALGTTRAAEAASAYIAATRESNRALAERKKLLREVAASEAAAAAASAGMRFTFGGPKALPLAGTTAFKGEVVGGMGGGARRALTNKAEFLGGARTQDQADVALRFAQALQQQVRPLSQFQALYAGITSQAAAILRTPALPSSEMLNAAAKGIKNLEVGQDQYNRELQESAERLKQLDRLEASRARRARKLQGIADYYGGDVSRMAGAGFGVPGPAAPLGDIQKPKKRPAAKGPDISGAISNAIIGGAFPLLFGQGAGAAAGGAIGGVAGQLALGPAGGFAGSLLGTAVGSMADTEAEIKKLAAALDLTGAAADRFSASFRQAGVDLQTFKQAVNTIQGINIPFEQQATAIQIAANVSKNYKGSLTAVASTIKTLGSTGEVNIKTLQSLTAANVPIVQRLADKYGVTKDKIMEMAADGSISVSTLIQELNNLGNQTKPQTAIEKLSETFSKLTTNTLKVFGPVFEGLGDVVTGIADKISNGFGYVADVIFPKLAVAVSPIAEAFREAFPTDLFDTVADFFQRILIRAIEGVVFIIGKLSPVLAFIIKKFKQLSNNPVFKFIAEQVARLANFLGLTNVEVDNYAKRQKKAADATKASEEEARKLAAALIEAGRVQLRLTTNRLSVETAVLQKRQAITAAQIAELEQRRQLAMSFKEEEAIINSIADKKIKAAAQAYEIAKLEQQQKIEAAATELQAVQIAYEKGEANENQLRLAQSNLNTVQQIAAETLEGAEATRDQAAAAADLEARMEKVAAFAKDAAAKTELFNQAAQRSVNALNNNLKTVEAFSNAQTTINNLEIQSLQNKLTQAKTDAERFTIAQKIKALEISNAKIALQSTRAQIKAEVERQRIALAMAEVKYKELLSVVKYAEAQGVIKRELLQSLEAQKSALAIAQDNYRTSVQVANEQYRAADAVYKAAVNAAELKANLEGGAQAAAAIAGSMERGGFLTASNIKNPILRAEAEGRLADVDRRTMSGGNPLNILKALDEKQQIVLNYMALEKKAAQEQQMQSAAQELRSLGLSRYIPMEYRTQEDKPALFQRYGASASSSSGSVNPQVSITTGPVMRMGDQNYVSQNDLMSATSSAARQGADMAISRLKNDSATRRSVGILR